MERTQYLGEVSALSAGPGVAGGRPVVPELFLSVPASGDASHIEGREASGQGGHVEVLSHAVTLAAAQISHRNPCVISVTTHIRSPRSWERQSIDVVSAATHVFSRDKIYQGKQQKKKYIFNLRHNVDCTAFEFYAYILYTSALWK